MANSIPQASSVLLARGLTFPEFFIVHRAPNLRFFGNFLAFPGGKANFSDRNLEVLVDVPASSSFSDHFLWVTAARELFEETGVLLARTTTGEMPEASIKLEELRHALISEQLSFSQILLSLGLSIRQADFRPIGNVVTPPFTSIRFDTTFFFAEMPRLQQAEVWRGELANGNWMSADQVLEDWERGESLVSPPAVMMLRALRHQPLDRAISCLSESIARLSAQAIPPIYLSPHVRLLPMRTQGLPPSTHTNAFLIGKDPVYLIDPGCADADEQEKLFQSLEKELDNRSLTAIILSHQHPDHIGAAVACSNRFGAPIWAHCLTARALQHKIAIHHEIRNGECLSLGCSPCGKEPWFLEAIHTPGHAAGHLAFYDSFYRFLFVGDMLSTQSSVVIAPPEGNLTEYLDSLKRLQKYDARLLLPAHGGMSSRPGVEIEDCLSHRAKREEMLLRALGDQSRQISGLTVELYKGLPEPLMRFARLQVLAGLQKLEREGRVGSSGDETERAWRMLL